MANGCNVFGPKDKDGQSCCDEHDKAYVSGSGKFKADWALLKCQIKAGHPISGVVMYLFLTPAGWPLYLKYRTRAWFNWFPKQED